MRNKVEEESNKKNEIVSEKKKERKQKEERGKKIKIFKAVLKIKLSGSTVVPHLDRIESVRSPALVKFSSNEDRERGEISWQDVRVEPSLGG